MKIGIMTWYKYKNYGTKLQAIALCKFLENEGNKVEFINYMPRSVKKDFITKKNMKERIYTKIKHKNDELYLDNNDSFEKFTHTYFKETEACDSFVDLYQLNKDFDCFICGSDQIWNPTNFNSKYFLDFADKNKIISYAPSFGVSKINNEIIKKEMSKYINRINFLSVREKQGAKLIKQMCNKEAKVVIDPTLLLSKDDWKIFENSELNTELKQKKYLVTYFLGESDSYINSIKKFAERNNLIILNIPVYKNKKINKYNFNNRIGPGEFLSLIKNSQLIFTDSFHGTIFSIIYEKNFFVYERFSNNSIKSQNSRITNLLEQLMLNNRLLRKQTKIDSIDIDYNIVNKNVENLKKDSKKFLIDSLLKIKNIEKEKTEKSGEHITDYCSGCGACAAICPSGALSVELNENGFQQYHFVEEKCIHCGLCKKVCPMLQLDTTLIKQKMKLYSLISKEQQILLKSSSGGASYLLTELLNNQYYVCGCYYNNETDKAEHIIIMPKESDELKKIQGSKYIQSNTSKAFKEIIEIGKNNRVLFIGTPCQVAGLDKLTKLKKIRDNFILVDIICHGVPTYNLWKKYLTDIKEKYPILKNNHNIIIRDGKLGKNRSYVIKMYSEKKLIYKNDKKNDDFYRFFTDGTISNKSCFECPYRLKTSADIRIGDFWGEKFKNDLTGVSMIIPVTSHGEKLIDELKREDKATIEEHEISDYFLNQQPYNQIIPYYREQMLKDLQDETLSLHKIRKKYFKYEDIKMNIIGKYKKIKGIIKK